MYKNPDKYLIGLGSKWNTDIKSYFGMDKLAAKNIELH